MPVETQVVSPPEIAPEPLPSKPEAIEEDSPSRHHREWRVSPPKPSQESGAGTETAAVEPIEDLSERISRRAFELYVACGCGVGHDVEHWLDAERELTGA